MLSIFQLLMEQAPSHFTQSLLFSSLLSLLIVLILIKWLFSNNSSITKNQPPSPLRLPIIGNLHQMGLLPHRSLHSLALKHGPIMLLQLGTVRTLVISSANAAYEIMKVHDIVFSNRPKSSKIERLLYDYKDVSMAPYGEFWRQLKSIYVLQLLSNRRVRSYHGVREEETGILVKRIKELGCLSLPVNLSELLMSLTSDVICRAVMGRKLWQEEKGENFKMLLRDLMRLLGDVDIGDFLPWLAWVNKINGFDSKVDRVAKGLDELLDAVVEERMNCPNNEVEDHEGTKSFFNILFQIHKGSTSAQGISIDRDCIKAQILIAFAAGTDTTYTFLEWAMAELLRNPRVMKKLQNEVREILSCKVAIVEDDLEKMNYLKAVIKETLRLHPPIPVLVPREAREDVKVMGYDVAAGTMVMINAWAIGRDSNSWDEPEEFRPERFLNSSIDFKGHDFELIPFGGGRRGCPGIGFATATSELVLANLVHKFDWELPEGAKGEDLNMIECVGATAHRKFPLVAIATPCSC